MAASSFDPSRAASPLEDEAAAQVHLGVFLGSFALCLGTGCLLMLPLAPPYRLIGAHYSTALLPLLFAWWGIVTPCVTYWLFQQFVSTNQRDAASLPARGAAQPVTEELDLAMRQPAYRWSAAKHQKRYELILHMARQGEPLEAIAVETGIDEKRIASFILSYRLWGPDVVRTASRHGAGDQQPKLELMPTSIRDTRSAS